MFAEILLRCSSRFVCSVRERKGGLLGEKQTQADRLFNLFPKRKFLREVAVLLQSGVEAPKKLL